MCKCLEAEGTQADQRSAVSGAGTQSPPSGAEVESGRERRAGGAVWVLTRTPLEESAGLPELISLLGEITTRLPVPKDRVR